MSFRPRTETANWAGAAAAGCAVLAIAARDGSYLFPGVMCLALLLQCAQRIEVDGRCVQRMGLRPVTLDLGTAEVAFGGSSWWRELFFCGPVFQLRDADGRRLYVESWLWPSEVRLQLLDAVHPGTRP